MNSVTKISLPYPLNTNDIPDLIRIFAKVYRNDLKLSTFNPGILSQLLDAGKVLFDANLSRPMWEGIMKSKFNKAARRIGELAEFLWQFLSKLPRGLVFDLNRANQAMQASYVFFGKSALGQKFKDEVFRSNHPMKDYIEAAFFAIKYYPREQESFFPLCEKAFQTYYNSRCGRKLPDERVRKIILDFYPIILKLPITLNMRIGSPLKDSFDIIKAFSAIYNSNIPLDEMNRKFKERYPRLSINKYYQLYDIMNQYIGIDPKLKTPFVIHGEIDIRKLPY